jgi:hypothetical protein
VFDPSEVFDFEGIGPDLRWDEEGAQHVPSELAMYSKLGLAAEDERENKERERRLLIIVVIQIIQMSLELILHPPCPVLIFCQTRVEFCMILTIQSWRLAACIHLWLNSDLL